MSEDIVERLRGVDHMSVEDCFLQSSLFEKAADEIERLRAENRNRLEAISECDYLLSSVRNDLTEALRLMEPVAETVGGMVNGNWTYTVPYDDARAIADFVKRMMGGANE